MKRTGYFLSGIGWGIGLSCYVILPFYDFLIGLILLGVCNTIIDIIIFKEK